MTRPVSKRTLKKAYQIGLDEGAQMANNVPRTHTIEIYLRVDGEEYNLGHYLGDIMEGFTQFSEWSGFYLPTFREMAGFKDTNGMGTFRDGDEDCDWNFEDIMDKFDAGLMDGFEENIIRRALKSILNRI